MEAPSGGKVIPVVASILEKKSGGNACTSRFVRVEIPARTDRGSNCPKEQVECEARESARKRRLPVCVRGREENWFRAELRRRNSRRPFVPCPRACCALRD